jgi:hypothetical protein
MDAQETSISISIPLKSDSSVIPCAHASIHQGPPSSRSDL